MELSKNTKIKTLLVIILVSFAMIFMLCFNTLALNTSYNRPWNTPTKSIEGGAEFLAKDYINQGQYNPYLERFNVVPTNKANLYSHQYCTDLQAVCRTSKTSFASFKANGLLSLPLVFDIPVYENMKDYYAFPKAGVSCPNFGPNSSHDQAFVQSLRDKGFPELYIGQLADLHAKYPNWTFNAIKTGIDFETAVSAEKKVSYVDINGYYGAYLYDKNYTKPQEGSNWYYASWDAVAFYMDPRNALDEENILMFYSSKFNSNYTISAVQTVLNNSFMSGNESISGNSYASIFYEAGRKANVNPVYLASKSIQEVGRSGSISTSGESYEYRGLVYHGLYNFFNIGAYSSAQNPVLQGLVYANGGEEASANAYVKGQEPPTPTPTPTPDPTPTPTPSKPEETIMLGDVNGNGEIDPGDYLMIMDNILGIIQLNTTQQKAADVNKNGEIDPGDYLMVMDDILGLITLQ